MGWGVSSLYPQKEALFDTISSSRSATPSLMSPSAQSSSAVTSSSLLHQLPSSTTVTTKKETNIWFPFDNTDSYNSRSGSARSDKNLLLSPFATPPLPTPVHEKKPTTSTLSSALASPSCRFYPAVDKHDLFSSYANIVSEASSSTRPASVLPFSPLSDASSPSIPAHQSHHHRPPSSLPFSPLSDGPSPGIYAHHHHDAQHHSQMHQNSGGSSVASSSHSSAASGLFGSPFAAISPYSFLQNMGYEPTAVAAAAVAAAAGKARCALPSPTIFPPTPPPSAPWNPWSGF